MTYPSGISSWVGFGQESTPGTAVTVDHFYRFDDESLVEEPVTYQGEGFAGGVDGPYRVRQRRRTHARFGAGSVTMGVPKQKLAFLLKNIFGTITGPTQQAATTAYQVVATPGSLYNLSMTAQKALPDVTGTKKAFTYPASKFDEATFSCDIGEELKLELSLNSNDVVTNISAATASYPATDEAFFYTEGHILLGGTASTASGIVSVSGGTEVVEVTGVELTNATPMRTGSDNLRFGGAKRQQRENNWRDLTGTLSGEFENQATRYDLFHADTPAALVLKFEGNTIASTYKELLEIIVPSISFDSGTPTVGGPDLIELGTDFVGLSDRTNAVVQARYVSVDTTI